MFSPGMVNPGPPNPGLDEPEPANAALADPAATNAAPANPALANAGPPNVPAAAARTGPGTTLNNANNTRTAIQAPRLAFVRALEVPENGLHASFICSALANPATLAARRAELDDALARLRQQ